MKDKLRIMLMESIIFFMLYYLSNKRLSSEYLFSWAAFNYKFYLVLVTIPLILILFNRKTISTFMSLGITIGIFIGNYLGKYLLKINLDKITDSMSQEEIYMLRSNKGFYIWMTVIVISIILGVVWKQYSNRNNLKVNTI